MHELIADSKANSESAKTFVIIILIVIIIIGVAAAVMITLSITRPINEAINVADKIADGDLSVTTQNKRKDETGKLLNALGSMTKNLKNIISEINHLSGSAVEGKLDVRADDKKYQGEYRDLVGGLNNTLNAVITPLNVTAEYVDRISKGDIPPKITDNYKGDFNEIKNNLNQLIDSLNGFVDEMNNMAHEHEAGDIDVMISSTKFHGVYKEMAVGVNQMVVSHINVKKKAMDIVQQYADGNFEATMEPLPGKKIFVNKTLDSIRFNLILINDEIKTLIEGSKQGNLSIRADADKFQGDWAKLMKGTNQMLDEILVPINEGNRVLRKISGGDLSETFNLELKGDHKAMQNAINGVHSWFNGLIAYITKIANGDLTATIDKASDSDQVYQWLVMLRENLNSLINDVNALSSEAVRGKLDARANAGKYQGSYYSIVDGINRTLDAVGNAMNISSNLMIGDVSGTITYMNSSVKKLLQNEEQNIRKSLPNFNAKDIIGKNIDEFHKNPAHQKQILANLSGVHSAMIKLGDKFFKLAITPMKDSTGAKLGYVVEWFEYNNQAVFEQSLKNLIEQMTDGNFKERINVQSLDGTYHDIAVEINKMIDSILTPIQEGNRILRKIRGGDLSETLTLDLKGDHKAMQDAVNGVHGWLTGLISYVTAIANGDMTAEIEKASANDQIHQWLVLLRTNIKNLVTDVNYLAQAAIEGKLQVRADAKSHSGDYRKIVEGINNTLDNFITPINETIEVLQALEEGDLTTSIKGDYKGDLLKLKNALNATVSSMDEILSQVSTTVDEVNNGAMQVSDASNALSQGATEQAASLEEITSSMSELGSQTRANAENANQANILTNNAKEAAEKGNREMEQLNKAMQEITESSKNISKIIKVIDEIAFQTNLLALNAAVEAARAGRHGKGFAVVAEEVRNLAARSATAAKETSELIENSIKTVENGSTLASRTGEALDEIRRGAIKSADIVAEIATSSSEQAEGISQINEGLIQIDKVTQTNTASAEESASASDELSSQANQLKNMITRFTLRNSGAYRNFVTQPQKRVHGSGRDGSKRLPQASEFDHRVRPEEIINLDEDDFGKY